MPTNILNAQVPIGQPFLEADGRTVTQIWQLFFLSLSKRTSTTTTNGSGGGQGVSTSSLAAEISNQGTQIAALDEDFINLSVETSFDDITTTPQNPVFQTLLSAALEEPPLPVPVNPFLAAILVSDPS